ncbi:MAG: glycine cleavage system aminomethyltransferase GcvT [Verrucomicrobia bacterium]|nr:glycine cleavage system aminomethyltransferase GcvT [Verrucomicrobiota bacterium]
MVEHTQPRRTPFHQTHLSLGARMIEFFGWEMPVQYSSIIEEHRCVRSHVGIFDLSHMGEFEVRGPKATAYLQQLLTNNVERAADGKAMYSALCKDDGRVLDDLLVYKRAQNDFLVVVNASNIEKDFAWFAKHRPEGVELVNRSYDVALVAVQGPKAKDVVGPIVSAPTDDLYYYEFREDEIAGRPVTLARTGYTGEDGFEIYVQNADAQAIWDAVWRAGQPYGMLPIGLGARDTLRLEMGYALYGHELTEAINPIEAGIGWVVSAKTGDGRPRTFFGSDIVLPLKKNGAARTLLALKLDGKGVPRQHCAVKAGGQVVGEVTSGTMSPSLGEAIALALVNVESAGKPLSIEIRGREVAASVAQVPFVPSHVRRRPKE